jgi:hypothetical protein
LHNASGRHTIPFFSFRKDSVLAIPSYSRNLGPRTDEGARRQMRDIDPLVFLKAVIGNVELPLSVRMRAAIEVLPFTHPKLAVTAQVSADSDFAALLDRRIKRYQEMRLIEHQPQPAANGTAEIKRPLARTSDSRFRRI